MTDNVKEFEQYVNSDESIPKKIIPHFKKLHAELIKLDDLSGNVKKENFTITELSLKNFGCLEDVNIKFDKNIMSIIAPPGEGKTAKLEGLIFSIFGITKSLKHINGLENDEITKTEVTVMKGKSEYKIFRSIKGGSQRVKVTKNGKEVEEKDVVNISYDEFIESCYSGDLSRSLTGKKQIEIKQLFISLINSSYWEGIHDLALEKVRENEKALAGMQGAEEVINNISEGSSIEELKSELTTINEEMPLIKADLKKVKVEVEAPNFNLINSKMSSEKLSIIDEQEFSDNLSDLNDELINIQGDGQPLYDEIVTAKNDLIKMDKELPEIKSDGQFLSTIVEKTSAGLCPILTDYSCNVISEKSKEYKERLKEKRELYQEKSNNQKKANESLNKKISDFNSRFHKSLELYNFKDNSHFISDSVLDTENKIINIQKRIKKSKESKKNLVKLENEYKKLTKKIEESHEANSKYNSLSSKLSILESRKSTILNIQDQFKGIEKKIKGKAEKEKMVEIFYEISKATQRNNLPRHLSLVNTKKVEKHIKSFCETLLPFTKFKFDGKLNLHVDGKPIALLNSASKAIVNISLRVALSKMYYKVPPIMLIDDIGDSLSDKLANKLIKKIKDTNAKLIIYTSNRESIK